MAPGGIAEMCITAKVLQLGVPLVTAAHVLRVVVLIVTTGPAFRAARAVRARLRESLNLCSNQYFSPSESGLRRPLGATTPVLESRSSCYS